MNYIEALSVKVAREIIVLLKEYNVQPNELFQVQEMADKVEKGWRIHVREEAFHISNGYAYIFHSPDEGWIVAV